MDDATQFENVLGVFAHYGFRKASMSDLAEAAGVSRQTLYNRLKDKEAVLDWAVLGITDITVLRARDALASFDSAGNTDGAAIETALVEAISRKMGDFVPMLHESPHGWEIMDRGIASLARAEVDTESQFELAIAHFLLERGVSPTLDDARERTFAIIVAAKGLMMKCATTETFAAAMRRVVRVVI